MSFNSKVVWEIIRITTYLHRFLVFGFAIFTSCLLVTGRLKVSATTLTLLPLVISARLSAQVVRVLVFTMSPWSTSSLALATSASSASASTVASLWSQLSHGAPAVVPALLDVGNVVLSVVLVDLDSVLGMVPSESDFMADVLDVFLQLGW